MTDGNDSVREYNELMAPLYAVWDRDYDKFFFAPVTADHVRHLILGVVVCHMCGSAEHGLPTERDNSEAACEALAQYLADKWYRVGPMYVCSDCVKRFRESLRIFARAQIAGVKRIPITRDNGDTVQE